MTGFAGDIEKLTVMNENFRDVIYTGKFCQLVVMSLKGGEDIGREIHNKVDQFFRVEEGKARFVFDNLEEHVVKAGGAVIVPAGTYHNVINASKTKKLKLYTVYSPPNHPDGTTHVTRADAVAAEEAKHHK